MIKFKPSRVIPFGSVACGSGYNAFAFKRAWGLENVLPTASGRELGCLLEVGDVVFIRSKALPFRKVAEATGSWTNHVGIVVDVAGADPLIAESTFPFSRVTTFSRFVARSEARRVAVMRLRAPLTGGQREGIRTAAVKRLRVFYDTGFDLHSTRQFCSRFVREVIEEATGIQVGQIEDFATLFTRTPAVDKRFWELWYFGNIPWQRQTVTPAHILESPHLRVVFDSAVD